MAPLESLGRIVRRGRDAWPWLDHLVRAALRYKRDDGNRLAASLTYYAFLSLFPLLLLAMSVLGFVLAGDPQRQDRIFTALANGLPGLGTVLEENLGAVREHRQATGALGLAGVLLAGLGGVDALRESLRLMWHQRPGVGNVVRTKLFDLVTVAGIGLTLLVSFAVTALGSGVVAALLDGVGITGAAARGTLSALSLALALVADTALFVYLFRRLPRIDWPFGQVLRGAVFGAAGFGVLKLAGSHYVERAASQSTELYGTVGTVIGVLVGLNLVCRLVMFAAAWTVTGPGSDDVLPSATAPGAPPEEAPEAGQRPAAPAGRGRR